MNKPRYAIVRVDINCPKDVCGEEDFCFLSKGKTLADMCDYCDFLDEKIIIGDTKEQLIRKVAQVIKRELKGNCIAGLKDTVFVMKWCVVEKLAKKIVEFLGVE